MPCQIAGSVSFRCLCLGTVVLLLAGGCNKTPPAGVPAAPAGGGTPPTVMPGPPPQNPGVQTPPAAANDVSLVGELVTEGEYFDAAVAIEQAATQSTETLGAYFDMSSVCDLALKNLEVSEKMRSGFKKGFMITGGGNVLGKQIFTEVQAGGSYRLLHVHRRRAQYGAIFRLATAKGINYHDLKLAKNAQGRIEVKDLYILLTGELLSTTVRRMALPVVAHENRNVLQKMLKSESEFVTHIDKLKDVNAALQSGNYPRAVLLFESLPTSMREAKSVLIMRMMATAQTAEWDKYRAAAADYRRVYPGDGAVDMLSLDLLMLDKKTDEALAAIDRIDAFVGGDPHLDLLRSVAVQAVDQLDEGERLLIRSTTSPKALPDSYWQLITLTMKRQQFDKTLKYLLEIEGRYKLQMADLATIPDYAPFVASPQYQEWLKRGK